MIETGYWHCIKCQNEIPAKKVEPGIDSFRIYFMCPLCGRRNELESLGHKRGELWLQQTGK